MLKYLKITSVTIILLMVLIFALKYLAPVSMAPML